MCGIAGWAGPVDAPAARFLGPMRDALSRRGPDAEGTWSSEGCVLVHRRLAIIDPAGSPQPMTDASGRLVITYNGETYNYQALRRRLCEIGHRFRSAGDTEVLLELYREHGDAFVGELDAIFAFGLWDAERRRLLLARDRIGIKPLYYWHDLESGGLLFASDLRTLLTNPAVPRELDPDALAEYLQLGYTVAPRAWLRGVSQLPPGHRLTWESGRVRVVPYYTWQYDPVEQLERPGAAAAELSRRLGEAVEGQLVADVPVSSFLSGGIDSSVVSAFAQRARARQGETLQAFTVRFPDPEYDESERARAIAAQIGCRHDEVDASGLSFCREFLDDFVAGLGEPFGDTSALAVWSLCAAAKTRGKVALSGDGGDELFFGYTGLRKQRRARALRAVPGPLARASQAALSGTRATWPRRLAKALRLSRLDDTALIIEWHRRWEPGSLETLLTGDRHAALFPDGEGVLPGVRELVGDGARGGFAERQIRFHMLVDLPSDCLFKVDRMSMAHGVEVRVPLLSNSLLDFGARLPAAARSAGGRTKEPLRSVAEELVPFLRQPSRKHGFGFPLDRWLRGRLAPAWRSWDATATLARVGFVPEAVDQLVARYESASAAPGYGSRLTAARLFDLLLLALWIEDFEIRA